MPDKATLRMLIARLGWPVRMARWRVAQEYGALLSNPAFRQEAIDVFLDWLSTRQFESEVVTSLAVLFCCSKEERPDYQKVRDNIVRPSILSEILLSSLYGAGDRPESLKLLHSGPAPAAHKPERYFLKYKNSHVPPIFENNINRLEEKTGLPFFRQWAFEWKCITEATDSSYSGYPYHFVKSPDSRSGIHGQFSQRQCDVYRSAYLRTISYAVLEWGLPPNVAGPWVLESLPMNRGLANLSPVDRPTYVSALLDGFTTSHDEIERSVKEFVQQDLPGNTKRLVSAKVPLPSSIAEFADLSISAAIVSADFVFDENHEHHYMDRGSPWILSDGLTFGGEMPLEEFENNVTKGEIGIAAPVCLDYWPMPSGFWHNDYFQTGIALPASYAIIQTGIVRCRSDHIALENQSGAVATWEVWHDQWTPLYPEGGRTRCGTVTRVDPGQLFFGHAAPEVKLGWFVNTRMWNRKSDFEELQLVSKSSFFFD